MTDGFNQSYTVASGVTLTVTGTIQIAPAAAPGTGSDAVADYGYVTVGSQGLIVAGAGGHGVQSPPSGRVGGGGGVGLVVESGGSLGNAGVVVGGQGGVGNVRVMERYAER